MKSTVHGSVALDTAPVIVDEITLVGSRCGRMEVALPALRHHDFGLEQMISAVLPLERAGEAFELAQRRGIRKVLLRPVR
jgi:alcohol dehydrogenase